MTVAALMRSITMIPWKILLQSSNKDGEKSFLLVVLLVCHLQVKLVGMLLVVIVQRMGILYFCLPHMSASRVLDR